MAAYVLGLFIGNIGILPEDSILVQQYLVDFSIPLAIPLLLMTINVSSWSGMARKTLKSLLAGVISVIVIVVIGNMIFLNHIHDTWKVSGMLIGLYTGGVPNLASLKSALQINNNLYFLTHSMDIFVSTIYLFFIMTIGKKYFKKWLPYSYSFLGRFKDNEPDFNQFENYSDFFKKHNFLPTLGVFGISVLIFAISSLVLPFLPRIISMAVFVLIVTSFGVGLSWVPRLRRTPRTFELGMYFIVVFSFVLASMVNIREFSVNALPILGFVSFTIFGSLFLHLLIAKFFRTDADTLIITSTALICSPPFVPMVAGVLGNRKIIISGITVGIVGYAIGNYLGVIFAYLLR